MITTKAASSISQMSVLSAIFVVFLFMLVKYWMKSKGKSSIRKVPPGPRKLPLIGNLHQLIGSLPHHAITNLAKKYGPVMSLKIGEQFIVISSPEAAKEVLKTKEVNFAQRSGFFAAKIMTYGYSNIVFAPYGNYWRQLKKICMLELLSAKRVQSFRSIREEETWELMESISSNEGVTINLSSKILSMVNNVVSRAAFGFKCNDQDEFMSLLSEVKKKFFTLPDLFPSLGFLRYITGVQATLESLHRKQDKLLDRIINEHKMKGKSNGKKSDHDDLLDVLLKLQESDQLDMHLTTNQIKAVTMDIFSGGTGTTASTIEWAMSELLKNPRVMEKAQAEVRQAFKGKNKIEEVDLENLDYLKAIIKETLRLHPASPLLQRETREKCEINGYEIPVKAKVVINIWALGRNPDIWNQPDCFKPERFQDSPVDFKGTDYEFTPFGAGRRICPGISFAIANIEFTLAQMLYHFDWKLSNGMKPEELDMSETSGVTSRKKHNLQLIATNCVPFIN